MIMMDKKSAALDNGDYVVGIFLDFSKAFDTVNHAILLDKMYHYGIRSSALDWFKSYLNNRRQYVTYDGVVSTTKIISCGVPQASILGPLLFLIYINDLLHVCNESIPILFADDTNLFFSGKNLPDLEKRINEELNDISLWLKVNKLSLNIKKTHYMIFHRKKHDITKMKLCIDNQEIDEVFVTKFRGVLIDSKLTWKPHIRHISGKIARSIGMMTKAKRALNKNALITLYYSFVYPYFTYCNQVWGCTYDTNLGGLFVLQKRVIRVISNINRRQSTRNIFPELGILEFTKVNLYLTCRFMFRWHHGDIPKLFHECFQLNSDVHDYFTRQSDHLHVPKVKSNLSQFSIRYRGATVWNAALKLKINPNTSEAVFAKTIKTCIRNNLLTI